MSKKSAGLLLYRFKNGTEFFLVHPGGPFWAKKDDGAWSIPKGEFENESPLEAAVREFREETGFEISGEFVALTPAKQSSGKIIHAFAVEFDLDESKIQSNTFSMEWPPKSGKQKEFPEVDLGGWFNAENCMIKINKGQQQLIKEAVVKISG